MNFYLHCPSGEVLPVGDDCEGLPVAPAGESSLVGDAVKALPVENLVRTEGSNPSQPFLAIDELRCQKWSCFRSSKIL